MGGEGAGGLERALGFAPLDTRSALGLAPKPKGASISHPSTPYPRLSTPTSSPQSSGGGFLPREAARRAQLRRQHSSRKLQRVWRSFAAGRQTTRALAQAFADTGGLGVWLAQRLG